MVNVALLPAGRFSGTVNPLMLKAAPVSVACDTVRLAFPLLEIWTDAVCWEPTFTLPNETLAGFAASWPAAVTPVALRLTVVGELPAVLARDTLPLNDPAAVGEQLTVAVALCPGESVSGKLIPLNWKLPDDTLPLLIVTDVPEPVAVDAYLILSKTAFHPPVKLTVTVVDAFVQFVVTVFAVVPAWLVAV